MKIDAMTFSLRGAPWSPVFTLPDTSGLAPLKLPPALLKSISRFERTMAEDHPHAADAALLRAAAAQLQGSFATATVAVEVDSAAASARTSEIAETAEAVSGTILVTPSLVRGDGDVTIRLKQTVLGGAEINIKAQGQSITVSIVPPTDSAMLAVERSKAQLEQTLAGRLPSFRFTVLISRRIPARRKGQEEDESN